MLRPLQETFAAEQYPELLVGLAHPDDAAVYRLSDDLAVIQTLDFFPPVVDDPYDYGQIAAANAMSDVYAMGGEVKLALNIAAFPDDLDPSLLAEIFRGGADKVAEAGGVIAGGHTVIDAEPKYGLSVMGVIHPDAILRTGGAQPGDALLLTKPLGTGIVMSAAGTATARLRGGPRGRGRLDDAAQPPRGAPRAGGGRARDDRRHRLRAGRPRRRDREPEPRPRSPSISARCRCCPAPSASPRSAARPAAARATATASAIACASRVLRRTR